MKEILKLIIPNEYFRSISWSYKRFGLVKMFSFLVQIIGCNRIVLVPNKIDSRLVYIRLGSTDMDVYDEIIERKELEIPYNNVTIVVDAGAHIGLASIWFSIKFPHAKIYAIEPEQSNYEILKLNSSIYNNIIPIKKGLWKNNSFLEVETHDRNNWAFTIKEVNYNTGLSGMALDALLYEYNIDKIQILKVDIEGSEIEVFENTSEWIEYVDSIIIELHDRIRDGCTLAVEKGIGNIFLRKSQSGEKLVFRK